MSESGNRLRLHVIACEVFRREIEALAAELPHDFTFYFAPFGLHDTPEKLCAHLQEAVDAADADVVLLGYGLCSRGIVGLEAKHCPLVVPRAHDCMTLLLGSRKRYMAEFTANPGTYYYSPGWAERANPSTSQSQFVPDSRRAAEARARKYAAYVEKYGEDNAQYLMEMEAQWQEHYTRATFIDTGVGNKDHYRAFVKSVAANNGWEYAEVLGDTSLMRRFLNGEWDEDFLLLPPGARLRDTADDDIIAIESLRDVSQSEGRKPR